MNLEPSPGASNSHDLAMNTQKHDVQTCLKVVHEALLDVKAKEIVEKAKEKVEEVKEKIKESKTKKMEEQEIEA